MDTGTSGWLAVVPTPIGNLEDITLRALRLLREADLIVAEDTRHSRVLLRHHGIATKTKSFHAHSHERKVAELVQVIVDGGRVALVSDAGSPVVSDPGMRLVSAAREAGVEIHALPGPSAVTSAIAAAGLRADTFRFVGFLPRSGGKRKAWLRSVAIDRGATVLFESPRRLADTLDDLANHLQENRRVAICRELTKMHEEVLVGTAVALRAGLVEPVRGEITLVIEATDRVGSSDEFAGPSGIEGEGPATPAAGDADREAALLAEIDESLAAGESPRDVARRLAEIHGRPKRQVYQWVLTRSGGSANGPSAAPGDLGDGRDAGHED